MALEFQEPTFSTNFGADYRDEDDMVHISFFSSSALKNMVDICPLQIQLYRTILAQEWCCKGLVNTLLKCISDIPSTFLNGHDCDMAQNISRMIRDSIMQRTHEVHVDHISVFIMVSETSCHYNVVNSSSSLVGQQLPSPEFIEDLASASGVYSLPAGASAIEALKAQDIIEEDCSICLQDFTYDSDVAKLPCSHLYHFHCILEWFVQRGSSSVSLPM